MSKGEREILKFQAMYIHSWFDKLTTNGLNQSLHRES